MSDDDFMRGYICGISCIVSGHGLSTGTTESLNACGGIDWSEIDSHDKEVLQNAGYILVDGGVVEKA